MTHPLVLVTGFGAFEEVETNPSREIARSLAAESGGPLRFMAAELPVSFRRVPVEIDRFFEAHRQARPALFMALGVQSEHWFRLEAHARARLTEDARPDVDGVSAIDAEPYQGTTRSSSLDLEGIVQLVKDRGVEPVGVSQDAGGYVCERAYYRVLEQTESAGIPGLFVHVPPLEAEPIARQVEVCRWIAEAALR